MSADQLLKIPPSEMSLEHDVTSASSTSVDFSEVDACTASNQVVSHEFSIDELREIAHHFGVPHLAQITDREAIVESIRRSL